MEIAEIKQELLDRIEQADAKELIDIYGLVLDYKNSINEPEGWDRLPQWQRDSIEKGIKEADEGKTISLAEVNARLRAKYGIDG